MVSLMPCLSYSTIHVLEGQNISIQSLFPVYLTRPEVAHLPPLPPAVFEEPEDPSSRSFFSEIIASTSDVKFSHSGRFVLSRDYLTVKVCRGSCSATRVENDIKQSFCLRALSTV